MHLTMISVRSVKVISAKTPEELEKKANAFLDTLSIDDFIDWDINSTHTMIIFLYFATIKS